MSSVKSIIFSVLVLLYFVFLSACGNAGPDGNLNLENETSADSLSNSEINYAELIASADDSFALFLGIGKAQFGDLDSIVARRYIRALVPFSPTFYYVNGKERSGLAYEALSQFETHLHKVLGLGQNRVKVIYIPVDRDYILPLLQEGYGDIAVAGLTVNKERELLVDFSEPTITGLREVLVSGPKAKKIQTLDDLAGEVVVVRKESDYYTSLLELNAHLADAGLDSVRIIEAEPYIDTEDLLMMLNAGIIPYTVSIETMAKHWNSVLEDLEIHTSIPLKTDLKSGWAMRKNSPKLKALVNSFVATHKKGTLLGNMLYDKYLKGEGQLRRMDENSTFVKVNMLESIFKKYGEKYQMDWLLMVAMGYQESGLDHKKRSQVGAVGIMQIMPSTASWKPIGIANIWDLENNIHAANKIMRYTIDHHLNEEDLDPLNRYLLALASYNAGPARVNQLRGWAKEQGLNPNVWFDNVELIAAKHIGRETVQYVNNIYKYYASFKILLHYHELSGKRLIH